MVQEMKNKNELIVLQNVLENWEKSHSIVPECSRVISKGWQSVNCVTNLLKNNFMKPKNASQ